MEVHTSLAEIGVVDFSSTKSHPRKYIVSDETNSLVEMILDNYPISKETKNDLRAPTRHFLWYAEQLGIKPERIDDTIVMSFLIDEVPVSNGGSTGRTLRCVKYATEYLRAHGNCCLHRDYTLLKLKNDHRSIIPAYSEEEILKIAQAAGTDSTIGKRDLAIILVAYCTGIRGIDIIGIKLSDIDWHNYKVSVVQSKTHTPIVSELNAATLNALADYILDWRPKCDIPEVFVTVKAPYRRLSKGFGSMIDKYCEKAGVSKITFRGFHSLRRSFETVMVSRGVPIETASQMMGHKSITEDKPYITHDTRRYHSWQWIFRMRLSPAGSIWGIQKVSNPWREALTLLLSLLHQFLEKHFDISEKEIDDVVEKFIQLLPSSIRDKMRRQAA